MALRPVPQPLMQMLMLPGATHPLTAGQAWAAIAAQQMMENCRQLPGETNRWSRTIGSSEERFCRKVHGRNPRALADVV